MINSFLRRYVLRTLIMELDKAGAVDVSTVIAAIDDTAKGHRETGDPNRLADAMRGLLPIWEIPCPVFQSTETRAAAGAGCCHEETFSRLACRIGSLGAGVFRQNCDLPLTQIAHPRIVIS